jgi:PAS domain S-box-containing protein
VEPGSRTRESATGPNRRTLQLRTLRRKELWVEVSETPLFDSKGHPNGSIRVHTDITDRRRAEIALRDSEARYRVLAEHATDMISRHTPDGRILYASPASRTLLGYGPEELIGKRPADLIHPDDLPALKKYRTLLLAPSTAVTYRLRREDGTFVWVETAWRAIQEYGEAEPTEIVAVSRDITERKRSEREGLALSGE